MLSHPYDRGSEFIFQIGNSTWSKVGELPRWWWDLDLKFFLACQPRSPGCWDEAGNTGKYAEVGGDSYWFIMDGRLRKVQAIKSHYSCPTISDHQSLAWRDILPWAWCCSSGALDHWTRWKMPASFHASERGEASYSGLSGTQREVVSSLWVGAKIN